MRFRRNPVSFHAVTSPAGGARPRFRAPAGARAGMQAMAGGGGPEARNTAPQRLAWIDAARGTTMFLVVLLHADAVLYVLGDRPMAVHLLNLALTPLRMPLFFLLSGVLAAGLLARGAEQVIGRRVLHYLWLYVVWWGAYWLFHAWLLGWAGPPALAAYYGGGDGFADRFLRSWNNQWFLYALAIYFAIALAVRGLPPPAQAAIAVGLAAPSVFGFGEWIGLPAADRLYHLPYFMAGVLAREPLLRAAPRLARPGVLAGLLLAWAVATAGAHKLRLLEDDVARAALSLLAVPAGIGMATLLTTAAPRLAAPLGALGRTTLAVYVLHTMTMRIVVAALERPEALPGAAWAVLIAVAATALAMAAGRLLSPVPGLFGLPAPLRRRAAALRPGRA